ncbi:hypothetical protein EV13_2816 [Prochlorococcus sp. MIT 0702]|nr:hypothetical protein EV13_2816 [Prochlorococcus sp. MIT 0702]KGG30783.1 hypothetical protein EV14_2719 [Prochlorococcus sp. MIT 0703]
MALSGECQPKTLVIQVPFSLLMALFDQELPPSGAFSETS